MDVKKRALDYCDNILKSAELINNELAKGRVSFEKYESDRMFQNGLNMEMLYICEMVNKLNRHCSAVLPQNNINFQDIADFRNFIAHDYGHFDYDKGWNVLTIELPKLSEEIKNIKDTNMCLKNENQVENVDNKVEIVEAENKQATHKKRRMR